MLTTGVTEVVVCVMMHIKEPLLLIGKSSPYGGSGFSLSLSDWFFTICLTPYNRKCFVKLIISFLPYLKNPLCCTGGDRSQSIYTHQSCECTHWTSLRPQISTDLLTEDDYHGHQSASSCRGHLVTNISQYTNTAVTRWSFSDVRSVYTAAVVCPRDSTWRRRR